MVFVGLASRMGAVALWLVLLGRAGEWQEGVVLCSKAVVLPKFQTEYLVAHLMGYSVGERLELEATDAEVVEEADTVGYKYS